MAGYMVLGFLAAFGALSLIWTLLGWILPSGSGLVLVCMELPDPGILGRYRWLRGMGFLNCPLVSVTDTEPACFMQDTEICSRENLVSRLEWEKEHRYGTGTGNSAGRHQRSGVPEL